MEDPLFAYPSSYNSIWSNNCGCSSRQTNWRNDVGERDAPIELYQRHIVAHIRGAVARVRDPLGDAEHLLARLHDAEAVLAQHNLHCLRLELTVRGRQDPVLV